MWDAVVKAPQGGPIYTHHFERATIVRVLSAIAEGLDLEKADSVTITITRSEEAE
jgi:hypothetical protein